MFGLPLPLHRRLKQESGNWREAVPEPHSFRATPISSNAIGGPTAAELGELTRAVNEGFTHIVVPANRDWGDIQKQFTFDCRVHNARLRQPLKDLTWRILQDALWRIVELDQAWLQRISPKDLRHPLLLPPNVFQTVDEVEGYWHRCDAYSDDRIDAAEKLLDKVERLHRKPDAQSGRSWLDDKRRRYRFDPSRHALSQAERAHLKSFRFCFEVPSGFHYDMTEDSDKEFRVSIDGRLCSVVHCNVTPWGVMRRGRVR
jgi:hypothetical protein